MSLRVLSQPGANISAGRNAGIRAASHDWIAVTDAGCRPDPQWLEAIDSARTHADFVAGVYRVEGETALEHALADSLYPALEDLDRPSRALGLWQRAFGKRFDAASATGRSMAFTRAAWAAAGIPRGPVCGRRRGLQPSGRAERRDDQTRGTRRGGLAPPPDVGGERAHVRRLRSRRHPPRESPQPCAARECLGRCDRPGPSRRTRGTRVRGGLACRLLQRPVRAGAEARPWPRRLFADTGRDRHEGHVPAAGSRPRPRRSGPKRPPARPESPRMSVARALVGRARGVGVRIGALPYRPIDTSSIDQWGSEHENGELAYYGDLRQLARYSVLVGYIRHLGPEVSVLDVGCGAGLLAERLGDTPSGITWASILSPPPSSRPRAGSTGEHASRSPNAPRPSSEPSMSWCATRCSTACRTRRPCSRTSTEFSRQVEPADVGLAPSHRGRAAPADRRALRTGRRGRRAERHRRDG